MYVQAAVDARLIIGRAAAKKRRSTGVMFKRQYIFWEILRSKESGTVEDQDKKDLDKENNNKHLEMSRRWHPPPWNARSKSKRSGTECARAQVPDNLCKKQELRNRSATWSRVTYVEQANGNSARNKLALKMCWKWSSSISWKVGGIHPLLQFYSDGPWAPDYSLRENFSFRTPLTTATLGVFKTQSHQIR